MDAAACVSDGLGVSDSEEDEEDATANPNTADGPEEGDPVSDARQRHLDDVEDDDGNDWRLHSRTRETSEGNRAPLHPPLPLDVGSPRAPPSSHLHSATQVPALRTERYTHPSSPHTHDTPPPLNTQRHAERALKDPVKILT